MHLTKTGGSQFLGPSVTETEISTSTKLSHQHLRIRHTTSRPEIPIPQKSHICLHSDNMTTVYCINRQGLAKSRIQNSWVLSILHLHHKKSLFLTAVHTERVQNVTAGSLSRFRPMATEWTLDINSFQWILNHGFRPQVDLFTTNFRLMSPQ